MTEGSGYNYNQDPFFNLNPGSYDMNSFNTLQGDIGYSLNQGTNNLSPLETAILRSTIPIDVNETEEIQWNEHRGIWLNKSEVINWKGEIPLSEYSINEDPNPEVITKKTMQQLVYNQEVAIRYLRPPTPPPPGEILIQQEVNTVIPPAPPLIIRQQPARPTTPQPLVIREAPPPPPPQVGRKVITISGKKIPPPPRKVIIERLAPLPSKPQSVIIERWLPYNQVKRRVIFQRSNERDPVIVKPKNVIIQWDAPPVQVKKEFKDLGIIRANPTEYVSRYGTTLKSARELPPFVLEIKPPAGIILASDTKNSQVYELEGDLQALSLIDLDQEGLSEYKNLIKRLNDSSSYLGSNKESSINTEAKYLIDELFATSDMDKNGKLTIGEAERIFLRINSRLNRDVNENDLKNFLINLNVYQNGLIDGNEFKHVLQRHFLLA